MSLYKRGEIYWCKWQIGGKRVRETTGTTNYKAAQEYHDRRRAEIWREAKLGDQRVVTWDEAALAWATEHAQHKKSYETDRYRLIWLTDRLTHTPITDITTDALLKLRTEIVTNGKTQATANRHLAAASAVLNYAHSKGWLAAVPKIPYLPEPQERFRWLTKAQALELIAVLPKHLAAMTKLALATGLRRANVTGLTWDSLDIDRRIAWIWPDDAKAGKPIAVPLNDDAVAVLEGQEGLNARYVFVYRKDRVTRTTTKAWVEALVRAGIEPGFTFHDLRHTWASWHVMGGTPLEVLRQLGGWAGMDMVLRYAHLSPGYVAGYAENVSLGIGHNSGHSENKVSEDSCEDAGLVGWPMGLEPTTTGITIMHPKKKAA